MCVGGGDHAERRPRGASRPSDGASPPRPDRLCQRPPRSVADPGAASSRAGGARDPPRRRSRRAQGGVRALRAGLHRCGDRREARSPAEHCRMAAQAGAQGSGPRARPPSGRPERSPARARRPLPVRDGGRALPRPAWRPRGRRGAGCRRRGGRSARCRRRERRGADCTRRGRRSGHACRRAAFCSRCSPIASSWACSFGVERRVVPRRLRDLGAPGSSFRPPRDGDPDGPARRSGRRPGAPAWAGCGREYGGRARGSAGGRAAAGERGCTGGRPHDHGRRSRASSCGEAVGRSGGRSSFVAPWNGGGSSFVAFGCAAGASAGARCRARRADRPRGERDRASGWCSG